MAKSKAAEAPAEPAAAPEKKITQREAVRQALAAGKELPPDGVKFVKDTFNIQLNNQSFSTLKSQIKKAAEGDATPKKPGRPAGSANVAVAHKPAVSAPTGKATNPAELAQAVKELVAAHGAETVKAMADVFAK